MEKSPTEKINDFFNQAYLKRKIDTLEKHIQVESLSLLPVQAKITHNSIYSPAFIPIGNWMPLDGTKLPANSADSLTWLRTRFNIKKINPEYRWQLYFWFANDFLTGFLETVEGTLWLNGRIYQGLDFNHREALLPDLEPQIGHEITVQLDFKPEHEDRKIIKFELQKIHVPSFQLFHKLRNLKEVTEILDKNHPARFEIANLAVNTLEKIDFTSPGDSSYYKKVCRANEEFKIPGKMSQGYRGVARSVGHSHIDLAWLWPLETTRRKVSRTFSTVNTLMNEYENYRFLQSQPQLYEYLEQREPELFEDIKKRIEQKRWFAEGGSWVEMDCNLPNGESLVRQFLYGKKYFREKFGVESKIAWLPDTFGFNANLPQLMKKAGIDYFVTSKLSWGKYTRFPHDSFVWKGIDGSEVLAHFLTSYNWESGNSTTYNGRLNAAELKGAWNTYAQKDVFNELIISFGYGDGGGGPDRVMLENMKTLPRLPELPGIKPGSPLETFRKMDKVKEQLPVWQGELYLEFHRGTYTSRAKLKKLHRKAEIALDMLEKAISLDMLSKNRKIKKEEKEKLDNLWKVLLSHQFHDILAGSSIHRVNTEAEEQLKNLITEAERAAIDILKPYAVSWGKQLGLKTGERFTFNSSSPFITGCKFLSFGLNNQESLYSEKTRPVTVKGNKIETGNYRVQITEDGEIASLKTGSCGEDYIEPGFPANRLEFYEDIPHYWDAWEIDEWYKKHRLEPAVTEEAEWEEKSHHKAVYRVKKKFRNSVIEQRIIFRDSTSRIDFQTRLDWKEKNILLKTHFPFNINTQKMVCEIPFGYVERPSHSNRPSDRAMFEVPALRWAAVMEGNRAVALLNDSKYGYSARNGNLSLTLLKSAVSPDPDGEEGIHKFTYSVFPTDDRQNSIYLFNTEAGVLNRNAVEFEFDPETVEAEENNKLAEIELQGRNNPGIFFDTLKPAEDGNGIIARFYENANSRGHAELKLPECIKKVISVNLLEEKINKPIKIDLSPSGKKKIRIYFKPFEIRSFRLIY
ncbi:MAG: alpha-mannosidase [Vulcanimicrobiota bacterium]